jgi:peptide-methionine (S)-S-oxide reductase
VPLPPSRLSIHQQYLGKNPMGYCGIGGTGVSCPIGLDAG